MSQASHPRCSLRARSPRMRMRNWSAPILGTDRLSLKAQSFTESVIREMTRLNLQLNGPERAINFAMADQPLIPVFHPIFDFAAKRGLVVTPRAQRRFNAMMVAPQGPSR